MKLKLIIIVIWFIAGFSMFGQTSQYTKFHLSVHAGINFPIGISDTEGCDSEFILPFVRSFGTTTDGAYFFTKNYGIGVKYHLFFAKVRSDWEAIQPNDKYVKYSFNETTHFIGPAFYARWVLGNTKWEIPANISIGYVSNKLSKYSEDIGYIFDTDHPWLSDLSDPNNQIYSSYSREDMKSNSAGIVLSTGICYRISSEVSIGVYTNSMLSNAKKQNCIDILGKPITIDLSRKINKIGISAGLNYNF
jgi:hypothetical protein